MYKYRPFDVHTESWLVQSRLYCPSARTFNDPFDCKLNISFEATDAERKKWFAARPIWAGYTKQKKLQHIEGGFAQKGFLSEVEQRMTKRLQSFAYEKGVLSLSEKNDDTLMFGHYADGHKGYCLQFNTVGENNVFGLAEKVRYSSDYPATLFFNDDPIRMAQAMLLTKSSEWAYEREWRFFPKFPAFLTTNLNGSPGSLSGA